MGYGLLDEDGERPTRGQIEASIHALTASQVKSGASVADIPEKLKNKKKKPRISIYGGIRKQRELFKLSMPGDINSDVDITVRLPWYMVAALNAAAIGDEQYRDMMIRESVRDWLLKRDETWWEGRMLVGVRYEIAKARDRFTRYFKQG